MESAMFHFILSIVVVLVFAGLTAYETQNIKNAYHGGDSGELQNRKAIFGAFILYGSFITMFIWLLALFGNRE
jgi:FtsH-binding integral membrane protein